MGLSPDVLSPSPPLGPQNTARPDPIPSPQAGAGEELPAAGVQGAVPGAAGGHRVPGGRSCLTLPPLPAPITASPGKLADGQEQD